MINKLSKTEKKVVTGSLLCECLSETTEASWGGLNGYDKKRDVDDRRDTQTREECIVFCCSDRRVDRWGTHHGWYRWDNTPNDCPVRR